MLAPVPVHCSSITFTQTAFVFGNIALAISNTNIQCTNYVENIDEILKLSTSEKWCVFIGQSILKNIPTRMEEVWLKIVCKTTNLLISDQTAKTGVVAYRYTRNAPVICIPGPLGAAE